MIKSPRIIFMGTPEFAVATLKKLITQGYDVVGVVTAADKPAGRGRKIRESAVKKFAVAHDIPVLQPENLKSEDFNAKLKAFKPDLQIVVAFRMLPEIVWRLPKLGTFNLHASLLPDYRGAAPINWAIINGEKETGVSTFFIDDKIDTGAIILQEKINIEKNETASELHDKLMELGSDLVLRTIDLIQKGKVYSKPQPKLSLSKKAPKLNKTNTRIDWTGDICSIYNQIRGLSMYPGAWTILHSGDSLSKGKRMFIYSAEYLKTPHEYDMGIFVIEDKMLKIAVESGFILPKTLKIEGKKLMNIKDFLNGINKSTSFFVN